MVIIWIESAVSDIWHISKHNFAGRMTWTHFPQHLMIPQLLKLEMIVFLTLCGTVCATHPTLPHHLRLAFRSHNSLKSRRHQRKDTQQLLCKDDSSFPQIMGNYFVTAFSIDTGGFLAALVFVAGEVGAYLAYFYPKIYSRKIIFSQVKGPKRDQNRLQSPSWILQVVFETILVVVVLCSRGVTSIPALQPHP